MPPPVTSTITTSQLPLVEGEEKIICTNCVQQVGAVHIECAESSCEKIPICLQCFSYGAECGPHKRGHSYRVKNTGGVPIFGPSTAPPSSIVNIDNEASTSSSASTSNGSQTSECMWRYPWSSIEETTLLDMVEKFNLGNCAQQTRSVIIFRDHIAEQVNPKRSPREVKEHYDKFYIRGRIGQITNVGYHRTKATDHTESVPRPCPNLASPPIRQSVCKLHTDDLRLLAYMPHRDDFEKEWNNEAETTVSGLLLMPDDDDLDKTVKLAQVDMYVRQVSERRKRKALARDYDLVPAFFKQERPNQGMKAWSYSNSQKKEMKLEKEFSEGLKKFNQYLPSNEMEDLVRGLMKEKMLKERIEELQKYRKNGIKTLEEGVSFGKAWEEREAKTGRREQPHSTGKESSSSEHPKLKGGDLQSGSVSTLARERPSATGSGSDGGRRSLQSRPEKTQLLSPDERQLCNHSNLNVADYLMVKVAVLRETVQKAQGIPMRTNVRQDTLESKASVKKFMRTTGWLSPFST